MLKKQARVNGFCLLFHGVRTIYLELRRTMYRIPFSNFKKMGRTLFHTVHVQLGQLRARRKQLGIGCFLLIFLPLLSILTALPVQAEAQAQATVGSYTVQSGDTLAVIADRFGVTLEDLIAFNNIQNRDLIEVGQVLLIPAGTTPVETGVLETVNTATARARPGETVADVVRRLNQEPQVITALNSLPLTARLFPGQPIALPTGALPNASATPVFGAVETITLPSELEQGRTGYVEITTARPLSLTATWNGLPLPFIDIGTGTSEDVGTEQMALLPVPALIAPAPYTVTVAYTASNGIYLQRHQSISVVEGPYDSQEIILPDDKGGLLDPEIGEDELTKLISVWSQVTPIRWWGAPLQRPIAPEYETTSPYGTRRSYNGGPYSSYHSGQDFGAPEGVPILAPAPGRIALAEPLQVRGNAILLDHGGGVFTGYWHLSEFMVQEGDFVEVGDTLGLVGTTGLSTGAHLHWELRIYGIAVDPMQFVIEPFLNQLQAQFIAAPQQ